MSCVLVTAFAGWMMFVENRSLHYIEADAQDVSALYRSTATVLLAQGGKDRQPCEAFICAVQDGASGTVYVALSLHKSRNFVIFSPERRPDGKETQEELIRDALAMVREWGFDMQSVNLNYSKALKEVVLNDLRVVRHPHSARKAAQKRSAGERQARQSSPGHGKGAPAETGQNEQTSGGIQPGSGTPDRKMSEKGQAGVERAKNGKESGDKGGVESVATRTDDTASRQGDVNGYGALKEAVSPSVKGLNEIENLKAELQELSEAKSDEEKRRAKEIAALRSELKELSTDEADGELLKLKAEVEQQRGEKNNARAIAESEKSALREELNRIREEKGKIDEISAKELSMIRAELEELTAEKEAHEIDTRQQLTAAKKELERLRKEKTSAGNAADAELESLRSQTERLKADRSRDEMDATGELAVLRDEIARMVEENSAANKALAGSIADLRMDAERLVAEKEAAESAAEEERAALSDSIRVQEKEISDFRELAAKQRAELLEEAERLRTERAAAEKMHATETSRLEKEILVMKEEAQSARDAEERELEQLRSELERLSTEKNARLANATAELTGLREASERLLREKDEAVLAASTDLEAARALAAGLSDEIEQIREAGTSELSAINSEIERLTLEKQSVEKDYAEQLGSATTKAVQLAAELLETEIGVIEKTSAARTATRALLTAVSGNAAAPEALIEGSDIFERIEGLLKEADRLTEENSKAEDSALGELASLKARVARLESEKSAAKKATAAEAEKLKAEARRLIAEREKADRVEGEHLAQLAAEVERLSREADAAREAASARIERLKTETATLEDARKTFEKASADIPQVMESTDVKPAVDRKAPVPTETADLPRKEQVAEMQESPSKPAPASSTERLEDPAQWTDKASDDGDAQDPFAFLSQDDGMMGNTRSFTAERTGPPVRFSIDRALQSIDFASPEDVLEIHQSLNRTRVAMEDNTTVTCDSFLCAVSRSGKPHVYIALYQVDSKTVLVYTPEKQPEDSQEFEKIMRDGMDFIEIVGFMMDGVELGKDSGGRAKVFSRIPVLRQVS